MGFIKATDPQGNIFVMHAERNMSKLMFDNSRKAPHLRLKIERIDAETHEEAEDIARGTAAEKTSKGKGKKQDEQ